APHIRVFNRPRYELAVAGEEPQELYDHLTRAVDGREDLCRRDERDGAHGRFHRIPGHGMREWIAPGPICDNNRNIVGPSTPRVEHGGLSQSRHEAEPRQLPGEFDVVGTSARSFVVPIAPEVRGRPGVVPAPVSVPRPRAVVWDGRA